MFCISASLYLQALNGLISAILLNFSIFTLHNGCSTPGGKFYDKSADLRLPLTVQADIV
ncbi:MAG: hypothetical protein KJP23_06980 [Deltaproteobacteria bacterium]|nr:hypothetical protein [Deltaproteobacteria bacterium]